VSWRSKASRSSGRRRSSRGVVGTRALVGPSVAAGILRGERRADDSGCPKDAEKGNVVGMRHQAYAPDLGTRDRTYFRGRVLRSVLRPVHVDPHYAPRAQAPEVGHPRRHRGRANLRKQEEPAPGSWWVGVARLAACHRFRKEEAWRVEKRKEVEASVPARTGELGFGCPHVNSLLQKSVGDVWP